MTKNCLIDMLLSVFCTNGFTQGVTQTDCPLKSATYSTVSKGKLQLETGISYEIAKIEVSPDVTTLCSRALTFVYLK